MAKAARQGAQKMINEERPQRPRNTKTPAIRSPASNFWYRTRYRAASTALATAKMSPNKDSAMAAWDEERSALRSPSATHAIPPQAKRMGINRRRAPGRVEDTKKSEKRNTKNKAEPDFW